MAPSIGCWPNGSASEPVSPTRKRGRRREPRITRITRMKAEDVGWVESSRPTRVDPLGGSRRLDPPYDPPGLTLLVVLEDSTHPTFVSFVLFVVPFSSLAGASG